MYSSFPLGAQTLFLKRSSSSLPFSLPTKKATPIISWGRRSKQKPRPNLHHMRKTILRRVHYKRLNLVFRFAFYCSALYSASLRRHKEQQKLTSYKIHKRGKPDRHLGLILTDLHTKMQIRNQKTETST